MGEFIRVEADRAGSAALGILIPPARKTFVILRPRSLPYDLLLCRPEADFTFHVLSHDEASACAQALFRGLRDGRVRVEKARVNEAGLRLLAHVGPYALVVCPRVAGQPYAPLAEAPDGVETVAESLAGILCPTGGQEVYFNTRFFERHSL